ncbi:MAG: hypothetical protein HGA85_05745 [Nanoarchaeota archaeon]|nr:hypothetical protein [Nanoarchaeota archaeon]
MDLSNIKASLRPDKEIIADIDLFVADINARLKKNKIKASCVPGGSVAKGTFLKDDFDVDLFVKFDYSYMDKDLSGLLEKVLDRLPYERVHGSRDYFQIHSKLNYEIVPVLDVTDPKKAVNVTDMSPLHVAWVRKNLKKGQEDDIRLAKKFCKAAKVYGAESYIKGFSGHVIDILIIRYGSFEGLIEAAASWAIPVYIDVEKHYKNRPDAVFNMNKSKVQGPILVVDPILCSRNASCAVSREQLDTFKNAAKRYLKAPNEDFFTEKRVAIADQEPGTLIVYAAAEQGKRDVVGSRFLKAYEFLVEKMAELGFVFKSGWEFNKKDAAVYWFTMKKDMLPEKKVISGPPIAIKDHAKAFKQIYKQAYVKEGRLYAEVKTEIRRADDNLKMLLGSAYINEKLKSHKLEIR